MNRTMTLAVGFVFAAGMPSALAQPMAKPGPEHEMLKKYVGDWDATVAFMGGEAKGEAKFSLGYGGFWLTQDFKGDLGGAPFQGRGTSGYDPRKKKYVSTWVDSMEPVMMVMEGEFAKDGKSYTEKGEFTGADGKTRKMKSVNEFTNKDTIVFKMYELDGDKEQEMLKITYKRKK
jgi:hypothetical protein